MRSTRAERSWRRCMTGSLVNMPGASGERWCSTSFPCNYCGGEGSGGIRSFSLPLVCPSPRSEEHTSELQSLMRISYAVICLKKKNTRIPRQVQQDNIRKVHNNCNYCHYNMQTTV